MTDESEFTRSPFDNCLFISYRVVVVFSESWLPSLLQLEQLINEGLANGDRCLSVPTPVAGDVLIEYLTSTSE